MTEDEKELKSWWFLILGLTIVTIIAMGAVAGLGGFIGKYTGTVVERKVFEESYQKKASDNSRVRTYKAQLSAVKSRLGGQLDDSTRSELEAQEVMLQVQINSWR